MRKVIGQEVEPMKVLKVGNSWQVVVTGSEISYVFAGKSRAEIMQQILQYTHKLAKVFYSTESNTVCKYCIENSARLYAAYDQLRTMTF